MLLVPGIGLACLGLGEDLSTLVELSVTQTGGARHVRCCDEKILRCLTNVTILCEFISCHARFFAFKQPAQRQAKEGNGKKHDQHGNECSEVPFWCFMGLYK